MGSESHNSAPGGSAGTRAGRSVTSTGTPARTRELRAQGRKTMRRLSDAGHARVRRSAATTRAGSTTSCARPARRTAPSTSTSPTRRTCSARSRSTARRRWRQLADRIGPIDDDGVGSRGAARVPRRVRRHLPALRRGDPGVDGGPGQRPRGRPPRRARRSPTSRRPRRRGCEARAAHRPSTPQRRWPRSWRCSSASPTRWRRAISASTTTRCSTSLTLIVHRGFFGAAAAGSSYSVAEEKGCGGGEPAAGAVDARDRARRAPDAVAAPRRGAASRPRPSGTSRASRGGTRRGRRRRCSSAARRRRAACRPRRTRRPRPCRRSRAPRARAAPSSVNAS